MNLRKSAKDQPCTFNIAGVCNYDPATTVLAHLPTKDTNRMGGKVSDLQAAYACSACHDVIDARRQDEGYKADPYFYLFRALSRTHQAMFDRGLLG